MAKPPKKRSAPKITDPISDDSLNSNKLVDIDPKKLADSELQALSSKFATELENRIAPIKSDYASASRADKARLKSLVLHVEQFSGMYPHPKHLREYEDIHPGFSDRIIAMTEAKINSIISFNEKSLDANIKFKLLAQRFSFLALMALIGGMVVCALAGQINMAFAMLVSTGIATIGKLMTDNKKD